MVFGIVCIVTPNYAFLNYSIITPTSWRSVQNFRKCTNSKSIFQHFLQIVGLNRPLTAVDRNSFGLALRIGQRKYRFKTILAAVQIVFGVDNTQ